VDANNAHWRSHLVGWLLGHLSRLLTLGLGAVAVRIFLREQCNRRPERRPKRPKSRADCQPVVSTIYRRPDPLIYDQLYLLGLGMAVTWDNPDIHILRGGALVDPHALDADTDYEIVARVWNGSTVGPAVGLPVRFSYLSFGIGTQTNPIGATTINLGVKGSAFAPALAHIPWRTPPTPGHYCLQVELDWPDDANPRNNVGQTNTDVRQLNSPQATFRFPVRNGGQRRQQVGLRADGYTLSLPRPCDENPAPSADMPDEERDRRLREATGRHAAERAALPAGWQVRLDPSELVLDAGQTRDVTVQVTAPDGFQGRMALNVNAFAGPLPLGGVTLYAEARSS
jgi:hypothetical protein